MSKKISLGTTIVLMLLAVILTFQITYLAVNNKYSQRMNELTAENNAYEKLSAVDAAFRSLYIGEIDEKQVTDGIIAGYIAGTGDKYATYMNTEAYEEFMSSQRGEGQGIGVLVIQNDEYNVIEVISVMPNSGALEAGIEPGDLIIGIDGQDAAQLGYYNSVAAVKGEIGTTVKLTVLRGNETLEFEVLRGTVETITVMSHMVEGSADVGYIKILQFTSVTPEQFKAAIAELQGLGATKFVFDVRYNPGGELNSITTILDYLLPEGPIIRVVDGEGNEEVTYSDAASFDAPIAVLVNGSTASAAELFSCALKDYNKATLVGTTTYGKGTMQTVIPLSDNSAFSVSYRMYNPPYSDNYEGIGITPDIEVELDEALVNKNIYKITDAEDNQLQAALAALASK
ncbi:MAG: S41 family peptidase [Clostridia bacterium]|nr:S41 family peptidase [Clostridia bacterium]